MLLTIKKSAHADEIRTLRQLLESRNLRHSVCEHTTQTWIGLETNPSEEVVAELKNMAAVEKAMPIRTPYKLASLSCKPKKTMIRVGDVEIGGNRIIIMAGPCAIESREQLSCTAQALRKTGVSVLRASAYKPRSSPYSFQGMGAEGLRIHCELKKEHGLLIETEVMDVRDVALVSENVDILRIGARNMQNFDLLKEVGRCGKPVILKRGISSTIEEWLMSAEYIMAHGNHEVILCERGIRTFETATRSTLDLSSIPVLKQLTHLPVIVDPSHAAGRKDIIPALSRAAVAVGADGLLIEVHHAPQTAKCDGKQALLPQEMATLIIELGKIAEAVGRSL
jgi:3-deoxy-7-phosphoheptulonate synthase